MTEGKTTTDANKKPALSSRLMQMKFMQRGTEKSVLKQAVAEQVQHEDDSKWVTDAPHTGLVLVTEGDPPPGAHMGHMSFSKFNPELQKLQDERDALLKAARKAATLGVDGKLIPDEEMADRLTHLHDGEADIEQLEHKVQGSNGKRVKSLREARSKPHKVAREISFKSAHKRKRKQKG
ncbi:hypothetical protein ABBQ32_006920 [Trebouxia sp. C0010 RCD-2024]